MSDLSDTLTKAENVIAEIERGHAVFIMRVGDEIFIRDNSGITGLNGEHLMDLTEELLEHLFLA